MAIPNWNKAKVINRIAKLLGTENPQVVVTVEEWARVTGSSRGTITIDLDDVFDGVEDEFAEATTEEIIQCIEEYYHEYGYEYDMVETESFSVDAYDDSERTAQQFRYTINGHLRTEGYVVDLMHDRIEIASTRGGE